MTHMAASLGEPAKDVAQVEVSCISVQGQRMIADLQTWLIEPYDPRYRCNHFKLQG